MAQAPLLQEGAVGELGLGREVTSPRGPTARARLLLTAGPEGTVLIAVFAPVREDWVAVETVEPREARWP